MILLTQQINRNDNAKGQQQWNTKEKKPKQNKRKNGVCECVLNSGWKQENKPFPFQAYTKPTNCMHIKRCCSLTIIIFHKITTKKEKNVRERGRNKTHVLD